MYYPHFGLKEAPFKITPNTDFFFKGGNRGAILDALVYAITNGEGIVKVVGEVGSGKTMICRMLQKILPESVESIYLAIPSVEPEHVLHAIAFELQLKIPKNADRLKVTQLLQTHLLKRHSEGKRVVIFVEEAQAMPIATLEEIRLLSNLETNQDKLLQIVLFGQPELDMNLNELDIRQLRDRITHSFTLGPLEPKEIAEYLIFRLRAAGYFGPHLFSDAAIKKLAQASDGLIRRVNILADKSLLAAFADNAYQVTPKYVKVAILDSEFGRKPLNYQTYFYIASACIVGLIGLVVFLTLQPKTISSNASNSNNHSTAPMTEEADHAKVEKPSPITQYNDIQQFNLEHHISVSKSQLLAMPADTLTIQIMTSTDDEQLKAEFEKLSQKLNLEQLFLYRKPNANVTQTIVLFGQFSNISETQQALQALPQAIKNKKPYLRALSQIQAEINNAR
jgi:type II secretory pathway predicted ATPase ExeA